MAVVYLHKRRDTEDVFYVGIGLSDRRAYEQKYRNNHWHGVVNKTGGFIVEIVKCNVDWKDACLLERELICKYGRADVGLGQLVNKTDGGEGTLNAIWSDEQNAARSSKLKGRTPWNKGKGMSSEFKKKIAKASSILKRKLISIDGVVYNGLVEASEKLGISYRTVYTRLKNVNYTNYIYIK